MSRPFTPQEFKQMMELCSKREQKELALCCAAYFSFQLAMISRLDDAAKFRLPDLKPYPKYENYAFMGRLPWSKNVREERDAPFQLLFASMDPWYDTHSLLGLWLEYRFEFYPQDNEFVFCVDDLEDPDRIKDKIRKILFNILKSDEFEVRDSGLLGTHSTRKYAVTFARGTGCSKVSIILFLFFDKFCLTSFYFIVRMTQTTVGDGKTADGSMTPMLIRIFHLLMPRLPLHCAGEEWWDMRWTRTLGYQTAGFLTT